ncbi:MAG: leucine-rich repeat domain-containing protein [Parachlamydiales bacterium]|nr:hypothetical protein [Verrucomicrobiota bacterium]
MTLREMCLNVYVNSFPSAPDLVSSPADDFSSSQVIASQLVVNQWSSLKDHAPKGLYNIPKAMAHIERRFHIVDSQASSSSSSSQPTVTVRSLRIPQDAKVNALFHSLAKLIQRDLRKIGCDWVNLRECVPTSLSEYSQLQKDLALWIVWKERISPKMDFGHDAPPASPQEIRAWLSNEANRDQVQHLRHLDLSGLHLSIVPSELALFTGLTRLDLSHNCLSELPEYIGNFSHLWKLDLSHNKLAELPGTFGNLTRLRDLKLSENQLTAIPASFSQFVHMEKIDLSSNALTEIFPIFDCCPRLSTLNLSHNLLEKLPEIQTQHHPLKKLYLTSNRLKELPASIGNLSRLKDLDLQSNRLSSLPESFQYLSHLHFLDLGWNQLITLPQNFPPSRQIDFLGLCHNSLITIPDQLARSAVQIKHFELQGNPFIFSCSSKAVRRFLTQEIMYRYVGAIQYQPVTALGNLTNALLTQEWNPVRIEGLFLELAPTVQNEIRQRICDHLSSSDEERSPSPNISSSSTPSSSDLERINIFENRVLFAQTLQQTIFDTFEALPEDAKTNVYGTLYVLSGEERSAHPDVWGKRHLKDNIVALADAISLV